MANASNETSSATPSRRRRNILLAILGLLLIGLVYDFAVARPAVEKAYTSLTEKNDEFNAVAKHQAMGEAETREVLGREPSRTFKDGDLHVEVYSWRSGLPFRTHDLFVVYRPVQGQNLLVRLTKFAHDSERDFRPVSSQAPNEADTEPVMPASLPSGNPEEGEADKADEADIFENDDAAVSASDRDGIEPADASPDVATPVILSETEESTQEDDE